MEVRLRLQRIGKSAHKRYNYRIVAISKAKSRDSRHLEIVGHYDPSRKPAEVVVDIAKVDKWLKEGAQMSDTVKSLVKKARRDVEKA